MLIVILQLPQTLMDQIQTLEEQGFQDFLEAEEVERLKRVLQEILMELRQGVKVD